MTQKFKPCRICNLPKVEREEIEDMLRNGIPYGVVIKVLKKRLAGIRVSYNTLYNTVKIHHTKHLGPIDEARKEAIDNLIGNDKTRNYEWKDIYKEIKKQGMDKLKDGQLNVGIKDLIAAENTQTSKDKLQLQTDALQLFAAKYFSGIIAHNARKQIEGDIREGRAEDELSPVLQGDVGDRAESDTA